MKKFALALTAGSVLASSAFADPTALIVTSTAFKGGQPIPTDYAYCAPDGKGQSKDGGNISPQLSWLGAPPNTKSYALIVVDPDVPTKFDTANKNGLTIPFDLPRQNFYHWILTDIPASVTSIPEGKASQKVVKSGKPVGKTDYGTNGTNDYAKFYGGTYGGYDGPCPPWNDEMLHHYHFEVYALDTDKLGVNTSATGQEVENAIKAHELAKGELVGTYTQNQSLLAK